MRNLLFLAFLSALALSSCAQIYSGKSRPNGGLGNNSGKAPTPGVKENPQNNPDTPPSLDFKFALNSSRGGNSEIWLWHSNGGYEHLPGTTGGILPSLSAIGNRLTFYTVTLGPGVMDLEGYGVHYPVTTQASHAYVPVMSPDGQFLLFASDDRTGANGVFRGFGLWKMPEEGSDSQAIQLMENTGFSRLANDYLSPNYSDDGKSMIFLRRSVFTGVSTVDRANADGTNDTPLITVPAGRKYQFPIFSHSNINLVALVDCPANDPTPTHCDLLVIENGIPRSLTHDATPKCSPVFSLNDQTLYYLNGNTLETQQILGISLSGGSPFVFLDNINGSQSGGAAGNTISLSRE